MSAATILSVPGPAASALPTLEGAATPPGEASAFGALLDGQVQQGGALQGAAPSVTVPVPIALAPTLSFQATPERTGEGAAAGDIPIQQLGLEQGSTTPAPLSASAPPPATTPPAAALLEVPAEAHDALPGLLPNAPDGTDVVVVDLPILDGHSGKPAKDDGPAADDIPTEMASDGAEGTLMPPALPPQQPAAPLPLAVAGNREIAEPDDSAAPVGSGAVPVQTQQRLLVLAPDDLATPAPERQETGDQGSSERAPSSPSASALASNTGAPAEAGVRVDGPGDGLSSPLLTQTLPQVAARPTGSPYPVAAQAAVHQPIVQAKAGTMGADVGVEIAKVAKGGRDDLLIRLDPREMGRIDVRLSFDRDGVVRAVLSAESPAALDLLRRESGDLGRALTDAGIRADAQSLRFDTRAGGGTTGGDGWQRGQQAQQEAARAGGLPDDGAQDFTDPVYRPLRASGHVDLMA